MSDGWFDGTPDEEFPKRDRWGRPLLIPAAGGDRLPYTRASTLGDYLQSFHGLHTWEMRHLIKGLSDREDLAAMAAALPALTGDRRKDSATNRTLDEIGEAAKEHAGRDWKANWGTAIHGFTDPGETVGRVPERMKADVAAYFDSAKALRQTASEVFTANDGYQAAGTFDGLYDFPLEDLEILGDKKTGELHPLSFAIQMAVYSSGQVYDPYTDKRGDDLRERVNQEKALVIHIGRQTGTADFYWVDLDRARYYAGAAVISRDGNRDKSLLVPVDGNVLAQVRRAELVDVIGLCSTREELLAVYEDWRGLWDHTLTAAVERRLNALQLEEQA